MSFQRHKQSSLSHYHPGEESLWVVPQHLQTLKQVFQNLQVHTQSTNYSSREKKKKMKNKQNTLPREYMHFLIPVLLEQTVGMRYLFLTQCCQGSRDHKQLGCTNEIE